MEDTTGKLNSIIDFFQGRPQKIDLRELDESKGDMNATDTGKSPIKAPHKSDKGEDAILDKEKKKETEEQEKIRSLRFQFDGKLTLQSMVQGDKIGECQAKDYVTTAGLCDSLHAVKSASFLDLSVALVYEIKTGVTCDIVDENITARVVNSLGVMEEDKTNWKELKALSKRDLKLLDACSENAGGCNLTVTHDTNLVTQQRSRARVTVSLVSGPPNVNGQFFKFVDYTVDAKNYKACFVIEGDYSRGYVGSAALPTHKPVLTLRDPPGGLSYAVYSDMRTTFSLNVDSESHFVGFSSELEFAFVGKTELCKPHHAFFLMICNRTMLTLAVFDGTCYSMCSHMCWWWSRSNIFGMHIPVVESDNTATVTLGGGGNFHTTYSEAAWGGKFSFFPLLVHCMAILLSRLRLLGTY